MEQKVSSLDPYTMEEARTRASREMTAARADMKRMESRCNKAGEDASKACSDITEISKQCYVADIHT